MQGAAPLFVMATDCAANIRTAQRQSLLRSPQRIVDAFAMLHDGTFHPFH
ncbi:MULTISPECIES: hypothetical protein [Bradyrhizobium]|jgi:hypothetical protein|nr:hypothetical protein [Bradyrhizobium denitrificans]MCL8483121.1 hypothetical protein [Bradyrhizobium denitrificans]